MISRPDLLEYDIKGFDFIVLASDGIYDWLSNAEVVEIVWSTIMFRKSNNKEEIMQHCIDNILKEAMVKRSDDNVTAIIIFFIDLFK